MYRYRRQHRVHHKDNSDRWLVSYADYMTLMFALFVVLYAFVLLEKDEYREVVSNLESAIKRIAKPYPKHDPNAAGKSILPDGAGLQSGGKALSKQGKGDEAADQGMLAGSPSTLKGVPLPKLAKALQMALDGNQALAGAELKLGEQWLTLSLPDSLLFSRASATLQKPARDLLLSILPALKSANNYIRIRGYTDNKPISDGVFDSNWELSAARAAAVIKLLVSEGVAPQRLALEGYGAYGLPASTPAAQRRKVVLALSVYGWQKPAPLPSKPVAGEPGLKEVKLPDGGIRITSDDSGN